MPFLRRDILGQIAQGAYAFAPPPDVPPSLFKAPIASLNELTRHLQDPFTPLSGPPERAHVISWTTGGRPGVMGGWTRHTDVCGPLRLTTIDTQELFVEWVLGRPA